MWNVGGVHPGDAFELLQPHHLGKDKIRIIPRRAIVALAASGWKFPERQSIAMPDGVQSESRWTEGFLPELSEFWPVNTP